MKKVMRMLIFSAILVIPAAVFAQGSGNSYPRPSNSSARSSNFLVKKSVTGRIVKFKDGVMTIETKKKKTYEVVLAKKTKFRLGKKKIKTDELETSLFEKGKRVKITYQVRADQKDFGEKTALQVRFLTKKEKKKPNLT